MKKFLEELRHRAMISEVGTPEYNVGARVWWVMRLEQWVEGLPNHVKENGLYAVDW